ncbi:hypothetical protein, conserved [Leishmania tarentolae]|uniref:Transmembrane protein n=1 Tax=Leishmania tarentolae TaxID=5689 RepID=A0A640KS23_LEITA|nr:hypothetical protein, conserved [Leishmania tarentolae]
MCAVGYSFSAQLSMHVLSCRPLGFCQSLPVLRMSASSFTLSCSFLHSSSRTGRQASQRQRLRGQSLCLTHVRRCPPFLYQFPFVLRHTDTTLNPRKKEVHRCRGSHRCCVAMLRLSSQRLLFDRLSQTKLGAEVLAQTRSEMRHLERKDNALMRFMSRRRPIDYLAIEVDGPITKELHPSFRHVKNGITCFVFLPFVALLVAGYLQPTYYLLVPTGLVPYDHYVQMWSFSHWAVVLAGQLFFALVVYDLSVYVRYPFFAHVLAPAYRKMGWFRPPPAASLTMEQLKAGTPRCVKARPLGRPLGELNRQKKTATAVTPDPFGRTPRR